MPHWGDVFLIQMRFPKKQISKGNTNNVKNFVYTKWKCKNRFKKS